MLLASTPTLSSLAGCSNLVDVLHTRAQLHPERLGFTFLADGEEAEENLTFAALDQRARALAAELQRLNLQDTRALIVYEPGVEYLIAFLGCLYARVTAVPVYPPDPMRISRTMSRLEAILDDAQPRVVLTTSALRRWTDSLPGRGTSLERVVSSDELDLDAATSWCDPGIDAETVALLQYTSGSTSAPRGCVITHGNLLYNFQHILRFDEPDAVAVSWLPMYHDMGLIGTVLQVLHGGRRLVCMSPLSFVQRPFRWLQAISRYRAYATAGPNFGYDLCVRKIADHELQQLDLSCLTLACNGAEPIRHETLERFARRFAPCGLRREAFYPCYGLAEATLIVSGGGKYQPPVLRRFDAQQLSHGQAVATRRNMDGARPLVGCGRAVGGTTVRIVNPERRQPCPPGRVGEIWVRGPGVAHGYWNRAAESREVFGAYLESGEGPFLRTGDLGFLDDHGELFVVGRRKDLIIMQGRNHFPQDIEATVAQAHPSLRRDAGAAFAIDVQGAEQLVVVHEVVRPHRTEFAEVIAAIRTEVTREHEIAPHAIVLIKGGTLPKTSSGKLQRGECRARFLSAQLDVVYQWRAAPELAADDLPQATPARVVAQGNDVPTREAAFRDVCELLAELRPESKHRVTWETRLFGDLGLASIDAVALQGLVEERYGRQFPFFEFMAEVGRREARDIAVTDFVAFLYNSFRRTCEK